MQAQSPPDSLERGPAAPQQRTAAHPASGGQSTGPRCDHLTLEAATRARWRFVPLPDEDESFSDPE